MVSRWHLSHYIVIPDSLDVPEFQIPCHPRHIARLSLTHLLQFKRTKVGGDQKSVTGGGRNPAPVDSIFSTIFRVWPSGWLCRIFSTLSWWWIKLSSIKVKRMKMERNWWLMLNVVEKMLVKQCHKPFPISPTFYRWYGYPSQMGGLWHCFIHMKDEWIMNVLESIGCIH